MTAIPSTGNLIDVYRLAFDTGYALQAEPVAPFDLSWHTEKNGTGSGSFSLPLDDEAVDDITVNDVAAIRPNGTTIAAMVIEEIHKHWLDSEGGARQVATFSGRLVGVFLEWALIAPALEDQALPIEEDAVFDWRSPRYDPTNDSWAAATEIITVAVAESGTWPQQPMAENFDLASGAYMILDSSGDETDAPDGWYLFRREITITDPGRYGIELLMDNLGFFWIDGTQHMQVRSEDGFVSASYKWFDLSAETHLFTWAIYNLPNPPNPSVNPAALAYNLYKADLQGRPLDGGLFAISDSNTDVLFVGGSSEDSIPGPGMTVGEILLDLLAEAQERGSGSDNPGLSWLVPSFDATEDSNGDAWDFEVGVTTKTGTTSMLTFVGELVGSERVSQWRIRPDGVTWDSFKPGYTNPTAVSVQPATLNDPNTGQLVVFDETIT